MTYVATNPTISVADATTPLRMRTERIATACARGHIAGVVIDGELRIPVAEIERIRQNRALLRWRLAQQQDTSMSHR